MRRPLARTATVVASLVTAAAIAGGAAAAPGRQRSVAAPKPTSAPQLVTFIGGFMIANANYRLTLRRDGRGTLVASGHRHAVSLPAATLARLERELAAAHFATLKRDYDHVTIPIRGPAPTGVVYQGHHVTVQPGATMPPALGRVIDTLRAIVSHSE